MDEGSKTQCCQFATKADLEQDPEMYQCESCTVDAALQALDDDNREAWALFQQVCSRFVLGSKSVGVVLNRLTADLSPVEFEDVVTRLSILYDVYFPPRKAEGHDGA